MMGREVVRARRCDVDMRDTKLQAHGYIVHWQAQRSAGPLQATLRTVGEERLRAAVDQAVAPYRTSTRGVRLENRFRYVTATV